MHGNKITEQVNVFNYLGGLVSFDVTYNLDKNCKSLYNILKYF